MIQDTDDILLTVFDLTDRGGVLTSIRRVARHTGDLAHLNVDHPLRLRVSIRAEFDRSSITCY